MHNTVKLLLLTFLLSWKIAYNHVSIYVFFFNDLQYMLLILRVIAKIYCKLIFIKIEEFLSILFIHYIQPR